MEVDVIPAPAAARLAGVSYRQLDYWARCGWVIPSAAVTTTSGRARRRLYRPVDVVRLALLGHLGRSGVDVRYASTQVAALDLDSTNDVLVVWEPPAQLTAIAAGALRAQVSRPGARVVFDPRPVWARGAEWAAGDKPAPGISQRRTA